MNKIMEETINEAVETGNLDILIDLHNKNRFCIYLNSNACSIAALNNQLACLKYLHENGCPWNENTCYNAAIFGHLDCLKYAHENGCPWDEDICSDTAYNGHLDCLKYAHENGCPWNQRTCDKAAENNHIDCIKYVNLSIGSVVSSNDCSCGSCHSRVKTHNRISGL